MAIYPKYFQLSVRPGIGGSWFKGFGEVRFKRIKLRLAADLWLAGFPHLFITKAGAKELFGEYNTKQCIALLDQCRTESEVKAIKALRSTKGMKEAAEKRITALSIPSV